MDIVGFRFGVGEHRQQISIVVNDTPLADLLRDIEMPFAAAEGHPDIAGTYAGLHIDQLDGSPIQHFLGSSESHLHCGPDDKAVLLICSGCGETGCWPLMAKVIVTADNVRWSDFEQPHRESWRYDGLQYSFDRPQYEAELAALS